MFSPAYGKDKETFSHDWVIKSRIYFPVLGPEIAPVKNRDPNLSAIDMPMYDRPLEIRRREGKRSGTSSRVMSLALIKGNVKSIESGMSWIEQTVRI